MVACSFSLTCRPLESIRCLTDLMSHDRALAKQPGGIVIRRRPCLPVSLHQIEPGQMDRLTCWLAPTRRIERPSLQQANPGGGQQVGPPATLSRGRPSSGCKVIPLKQQAASLSCRQSGRAVWRRRHKVGDFMGIYITFDEMPSDDESLHKQSAIKSCSAGSMREVNELLQVSERSS